jgi:hypothetical protein
MSHGKRYIITITLVGFLISGLFSSTVAAEEPAGLENVDILVYPEYDDPRLLIIVSGHLPEDTPLPATLTMLLPSNAVINAAAYMTEERQLVDASPFLGSSDIPGWDRASFNVESTIFQFEYYHDIIEGLPDKTISFEYRFAYPVGGLVLVAQQPLNATSYVVTPTQQEIVSDIEGFQYYRTSIERLEAEEPVQLQVSYNKADSAPSVNPADLAGPEQTQSTQGNLNTDQTLLLVVGGSGLLAVLAAIVIISRRRRSAPAPSRTQGRARARQNRGRGSRGQAARSQVATDDAPSQTTNFCRHCGNRLHEDAVFCPQCGEEVDY